MKRIITIIGMKQIVLFIGVLFFVNCSDIKNEFFGNPELYEKTDFFVNSLDTEYESYGMFGHKHAQKTEDGMYKVSPTGRLINVRIEKVATTEEYEDLKQELTDYYENDNRVNKVYICGGGTVMIDCRN